MPDHSGAIKALFSWKPTDTQLSREGECDSLVPDWTGRPSAPQVHDSDMLMCEMHKSGSGIVAFGPHFTPTALGGTTWSHLLLVGKRSGSRGQTDRSLNTSLVWRLHQVWRECLAFLDGPDAGRAGGSGKVKEGGEEASLGLTGNLNVVETGQGATRQIHLKPRPTQSAIGSLEAESAGLRERLRRSLRGFGPLLQL